MEDKYYNINKLDIFEEHLKLFCEREDDPRTFHVHTGLEGSRNLNKAIEKEVLRMRLSWLLDDDKVTKEEYDSIKSMMISSDEENLVIAEVIINTKSNEQ